MKTIGAYLLTDKKTGKFYVGSSGELKKRLKRHFTELEKKIHHNPRLQKLWSEGAEIVTTVLPTDTREEAYLLEQDVISKFKDSDKMLNISLGVSGGDNLTRNDNREEIIKKIKTGLSKRMVSISPEHRKILFGRSGEKNGMWGRKHSAETKKKISEKVRAKPIKRGYKQNLTPEQRAALSARASARVGELNTFYGKTHSAKTREMISKKLKSLNLTPSNVRKVVIEDREYVSLTEASRQLNLSPSLIIYRIRSDKEIYSNYHYLT